MQTTRLCGRCNRELDLTLFSINRKLPLGRQYTCKECSSKYIKNYHREHIKKLEEYHRSYTNGERERNVEYYRKKGRDNYRKHRDTILARASSDNPIRRFKNNARKLLNGAVMKGDVVRISICERCGTRRSEQAHHEDYAKPLEVVWLCTLCHGLRHREINEERRIAKLNGKDI